MTSAKHYDENNIFALILQGDIPCNKVDECPHTLSFEDINPQAKTHILVIPKGAYVSLADFSAQASAEEQAAFITAIGRAARLAGLEEGGYRVIANAGADAHQEVPHLHMHILGGEPIGPLRVK